MSKIVSAYQSVHNAHNFLSIGFPCPRLEHIALSATSALTRSENKIAILIRASRRLTCQYDLAEAILDANATRK